MNEPQAAIVVTVYNDDGTVTFTTWHTDHATALGVATRLRAELGEPRQSAIFPLEEVRAVRHDTDWSKVVFNG